MSNAGDRDPLAGIEALVESAFLRMGRHGFHNLDVRERTLICIWSLLGEVNNGGFDQFYFNSSGDYAYETPFALRRVNAFQVADIVEQANSLFGDDGSPRELEIRRASLNSMPLDVDDKLQRLDAAFHAASSKLTQKLRDYLEFQF